MTTQEKYDQLKKLARRRQQTHWEGFYNVADYHNGIHERDYVSPYTKGAANVDSEIFVLLQDWASDKGLQKPPSEAAIRLGRRDSLPTNKNLEYLLRKYFGKELFEVYATNLFPLIKQEGMSAPIQKAYLLRAAREFALPQIEIVHPNIVICLGLATFNAIREATAQAPASNFLEGMESAFTFNGSTVWLQAHTGARGQNNRKGTGAERDENRVELDWAIMADAFYKRDSNG